MIGVGLKKMTPPDFHVCYFLCTMCSGVKQEALALAIRLHQQSAGK